MMKKNPQMFNGKKGAAMITAIVFFLFISLILTLAVSTPAIRGLKIARGSENSNISFYTAESGQEDVVYRLIKGLQVDNQESYTLNNTSTTISVSDTPDGKEVLSVGNKDDSIRKVKTEVLTGDGVTFNYGIQAGEGGFEIKNTASILGNAFSNGPVIGSNSNLIDGDVISAGAGGFVEGVNVSGSVFSHEISNTDISSDAYYEVISGTTVDGTEYPGSEDQELQGYPIEDSLIEKWKSTAEDGGEINDCDYEIKSTETLGPVKINCNVDVTNQGELILTGPVWIVGDLEIQNKANISIDPSIGSKSLAIIVDDRNNVNGDSRIILQNNTVFSGSGDDKSYILFISMKGVEGGDRSAAMEIQNGASGDVLVFAPYGEVILKNSVSLKEVTAYEIELQNSAEVIYEEGLANLLFSSGPSGGFSLESWEEVY